MKLGSYFQKKFYCWKSFIELWFVYFIDSFEDNHNIVYDVFFVFLYTHTYNRGVAKI